MTITYELPLNEKVRTLLRLNFIFEQVDNALAQQDTWANRAAIRGMLEIDGLITRMDYAKDLRSELSRILQSLQKILNQQGVDNEKLGELIAYYNQQINTLNNISTENSLAKLKFLNSIQQRESLAGGCCDFDLPGYHFWLNQPHETRESYLKRWFDLLKPYHNAIRLIVDNLRNSVIAEDIHVQKGQFQKKLDTNKAAHLVRVIVPKTAQYYPEISGTKHKIFIRLMQTDFKTKPSLLKNEEVTIQLACCIL